MKQFCQALCAPLILLSLAGCTAPRSATWPEPRSLGSTVTTYRPLTLVTAADTSNAADPAPSAILTLREALTLALLHNPALRSFAWEVRAREARTLQAGLLPNPELGLDAADFGGSGSLSGFSATEATLGLSQLFELGGDRRQRERVAALEGDLAGWDYESTRLDIFTETAQTFTAVLAAQERLALADSLLALARHFYESVSARVEAGKVSPIEERRAHVVVSTTAIAYERAARDLTATRTRLAAAWGSKTADFERVQGNLTAVDDVPQAHQLAAFIERNPDVARWRDEMALRRADVAVERARGIPDPVLSVGARRVGELGETALAAGFSIPLPLFDRNQGGVREARYRVRQSEEAAKAATVHAGRMLIEAHAQLTAAFAEVNILRDEILPAAQVNFSATEEGYLEGKFDQLMVLDAQRTLFETTNQYIDALASYHVARAEVERLIGTSLTDI